MSALGVGMSALCQKQTLELDDSWNTYLAPLGRLLLSSLVIWGWLHQAIRVWSGRYRLTNVRYWGVKRT
jgi:hypothetical protein